MINETEITVHMAAQYLAAANINFVNKEPDDSHTNLGFDATHIRLETHPLSSKGDQLAFNYRKFALEWISHNTVASFSMEGKTHLQILEWLDQMSMTFLNKPYTYAFHYDLPYTINDEYLFQVSDIQALKTLWNFRILVQNSLEKIISSNQLEASIRIWPHHFDTGIYTALTGTSDITVGLGLAIPDTVSSEHYLYVSGYKNGSQIHTSTFSPISMGTWVSTTFQGAILQIEKCNESEAVQFYQEALDQFKS